MFSKQARRLLGGVMVFFCLSFVPASPSTGADAVSDLVAIAKELVDKQRDCKVKPQPSDCDVVLQKLNAEVMHGACAAAAHSAGCSAALLEVLAKYINLEWMGASPGLISLDGEAEKARIVEVFKSIFDHVKMPSKIVDRLIGDMINHGNDDTGHLKKPSDWDEFSEYWSFSLLVLANWYQEKIPAANLTEKGRKAENERFTQIGQKIQAVLDATAGKPKPGARVAAGIKSLSAQIKADNPDADALGDAKSDDLIAQLRAFSKMRTGVEIVGAWYGDVMRIRSEITTRVRAQVPDWVGERRFSRDVLTIDVNTFSRMSVSSGDRYCGAEGPVRVNCEGKSFCYARKRTVQNNQTTDTFPNGDPAQIVAAALCGYDPVPLSDTAARGLVILYRCSTMSLDDWGRRLLDPRDRKGDPGKASPILEIVLRHGVTNEIRCAPEKIAGAEED